MTRAEEWADFKLALADLLEREEGCQQCRKRRRISDRGQRHHQRQCWAHQEQRFMLALTFQLS